MTLALWCVLVAALLPLPFAVAAKSARGYDNARPRDFVQQLTGWHQRAWWAHLNTLEAFPVFAAAVIICHLLRGDNDTANTLAVSFIVLRIIYGLLYIADRPTLRSTVWGLAFACVIGLFVVAA